ncbi:MAG TPA: hypothetical protein PLG20_06945 [Candidatus Syntrophosphaera sp.]|nr:hypothetical protein [Candidatus Syntrophosphaera sp.]HPH61187.1 hypothetical protein [Candidatus Syntrophosphaera sp.]
MLKFTMPKKLPPHRPKAFVHGSDMIVPTAERDVKLVIDLANAEARIAELEAENVKLREAVENAVEILSDEGIYRCPALHDAVKWICNDGNGCKYIEIADTAACWREWLMKQWVDK